MLNFPVVSGDTVRRMGIFAEDGKGNYNVTTRRMYIVYHWGRDCDCVESDGIYAIPASPKLFAEHQQQQAEGAEGPCYLEVITAERAEDFRPGYRDRILEAWEEGETYNV